MEPPGNTAPVSNQSAGEPGDTDTSETVIWDRGDQKANAAEGRPSSDEQDEWIYGYLWGWGGLLLGAVGGALIGMGTGYLLFVATDNDANREDETMGEALGIFILGGLGGWLGAFFGMPAGIHWYAQSTCEDMHCPRKPGSYWHALLGGFGSILLIGTIASTNIEELGFLLPLLLPVGPVAAYQVGRPTHHEDLALQQGRQHHYAEYDDILPRGFGVSIPVLRGSF